MKRDTGRIKMIEWKVDGKDKLSSWRRHRWRLINKRRGVFLTPLQPPARKHYGNKILVTFSSISARCVFIVPFALGMVPREALTSHYSARKLNQMPHIDVSPPKQLILIYGVIGWERWATNSARTAINNAPLKWSSVRRSHKRLNEVLFQIEMIWKY